MVAAIISVLIGIFPGFMMKFVNIVTPDNVAVAMPQYVPEGAPPFVPAVDTHGAPDGHGAPVDSHEAPVDNHGEPVGHGAPAEEPHGVKTDPHEKPDGH